MCPGLKRSMPCDDLISLKDAVGPSMQAEANRFLEESSILLRQQSRIKRQCISFESASDMNPATAALEAAMSTDDNISFDSDLVHLSLLSTWATDTLFINHDFFSCTKNFHQDIFPSVNAVESVAGMMSKLTTTPTAA